MMYIVNRFCIDIHIVCFCFYFRFYLSTYHPTEMMGKTLAYLRTSTDKQETNNQKLEILEFARKKDLEVDDFIELTILSRKSPKQRCIEELTNRFDSADTLIVTELSRLGRSTAEVIVLVSALVEKSIRVIILKQNLEIRQREMNYKIIITCSRYLANWNVSWSVPAPRKS